MIREMTYDSKCYELAKVFLEDEGIASHEVVHELAKQIQGVIEAFIEYDHFAISARAMNIAAGKE